jgi:outer membrane murein-binding lipoprotein Lpp
MIRFLLLAVLASTLLPGCVVWDIRNEMRTANKQLGQAQETLNQVDTSLANANKALAESNNRLDKVEAGLVRIDRTNTLIDGVGQGLTRIDRTNDQLDGLDKQLALLGSIEKSLGRLDTHLTAVRKTIGSINSMIPFLDLGGAEDPGAPPTASSTPTPGASAEPSADGSSPTASAAEAPPTDKSTAAKPRDSLQGIWLQKFPDTQRALVLNPDGRYLFANGTPIPETGTWKRESTTLVLTQDPLPPPPIQPAPSAGTKPENPQPSSPPPPPAPPAPKRFEIVSQSARALAVKSNGNAVLVFSRP